VRRRDAFDRDPAGFTANWEKEEAKQRRRIVAARGRLATTAVPAAVLERAARLCMALGTDGLRGELTLMRAARALAALEGDGEASVDHLRRIAVPVLRHRMRRDPLDEAGSGVRVERALAQLFDA
jgi:magnesium chelatase subunit I